MAANVVISTNVFICLDLFWREKIFVKSYIIDNLYKHGSEFMIW